jgi:chemotaxis protein MotB
MRRILYTAIALGMGVILAGCTGGSLIAQRDQELAERDRHISQLEQELAELQSDADAEQQRLDQLDTDLKRALGDLEEKEKLWLRQKEGMATVTMPNTATFASGSTQLTAEGREIIDKVWEVLAKYPERKVMIEGHTDDVPIADGFKDRFSSNWELSTARALAVLHYVREKHNSDPERLAAVGCGEHRPVADNANEDGRAMNRRVVIVISGNA